ncbi:hypothetical protein CXF85_22150 [Colwellia sp. 75C3]|uniref:hypothetical protein n=1 Tax=Colwellia sp. 75C3 TaxID=888425 RepID=UPI000C344E2B|nr:hypothetical protein [Colwellia sp. 75C3]PKG80812.1 hypothetical protein CXF85_22150 [Colwellia sp. 75C3]
MTDFDHRVGVKEANLVIRNLRLTNVVDANRNALMEDIDHQFGIDEISYNSTDACLYLAYDATNINLEGIEDIIKKHGADIHNDWWTHTKEQYYKFVDQNVKDNAKHVPWSCHKPPSGAVKKHKE